MLHLTINTGHVRRSPREEVGPGVTEALAPLLETGRHPVPGMAGYVVQTTCEDRSLLATVYAPDGRPVATIGVAPDDAAADQLWPPLERLYLRLTDLAGLRAADFEAPRRPAETPWCAAATAYMGMPEADWLGDFERCLAWAWLDRVAAADGH